MLERTVIGAVPAFRWVGRSEDQPSPPIEDQQLVFDEPALAAGSEDVVGAVAVGCEGVGHIEQVGAVSPLNIGAVAAYAAILVLYLYAEQAGRCDGYRGGRIAGAPGVGTIAGTCEEGELVLLTDRCIVT